MIIGCDAMSRYGAVIDYDTEFIHFRRTAQPTSLKFETRRHVSTMKASTLCATDTFTLEPKEHKVVKVRCCDTDMAPGSWGCVTPYDGGKSGFLTANGEMTIKPYKSFVVLNNYTSSPVLVTRGAPVATFHKDSRPAYYFAPWSLDGTSLTQREIVDFCNAAYDGFRRSTKLDSEQDDTLPQTLPPWERSRTCL